MEPKKSWQFAEKEYLRRAILNSELWKLQLETIPLCFPIRHCNSLIIKKNEILEKDLNSELWRRLLESTLPSFQISHRNSHIMFSFLYVNCHDFFDSWGGDTLNSKLWRRPLESTPLYFPIINGKGICDKLWLSRNALFYVDYIYTLKWKAE